MFQAAVVGHLCVDFSPTLDRRIEPVPGQLLQVGPLGVRPGGCVANTGLTLRQLGADVALAATIGDDELGRLLEELLRAELAELDSATTATVQLQRIPGETTSYSIVLQAPDTDRILLHHVGANRRFDGSAVDLAGTDLLHVGYPPLLPNLAMGDALPRLLQRATARGATTSLDLAVIDPKSDVGGIDWPAWLARVLPAVGVFSPSLDDLASVYGRPFDNEPEVAAELAGALVEQGAAIVAITCGQRGIVLRSADLDRLGRAGRVIEALDPCWAGRELWVPALATQVTATNGAGDAATAGLLFGLLDRQGPEDALLSAAWCGRAKVMGQRRLPRYASRDMSRHVAPSEERRGWTPGRRGVLRGARDSTSRDTSSPGPARGRS